MVNMKTNEFIEKANKLGYKAEQGQMGTSVYNETNCCTMAMVSENYENRVNITCASDELFDLIVSYAKTPVEERKEAKKYFIHVFKGPNGYLNIVKDRVTFDDKVVFSSHFEANDVKTKFSSSEISQLKKRDDIPLDWNKVTLKSAD